MISSLVFSQLTEADDDEELKGLKRLPWWPLLYRTKKKSRSIVGEKPRVQRGIKRGRFSLPLYFNKGN